MAEDTKTKSAPKPRGVFVPKGSTTKNLNLVVEVYNSSAVPAKPKEDGSLSTPGHFVNIELSQIEGINAGLKPEGVPQFNPALSTRAQQGADGKTYYNTGVFYTENELASIQNAIGDKGQPLYKHDAQGNAVGEPIGVVGVITADVLLESRKINHKTAKAFEGALPEDIKTAQFEGTKAARATLAATAKAKAEKAAEAPAVETEKAAPEAKADEPEFG